MDLHAAARPGSRWCHGKSVPERFHDEPEK